jgi:chitin disaccharide deacetylase
VHALEQLGFDEDATVAVVHADDIGMSHAANVGAFEALRSGPVTCGSAMVPCPWFAEAAARASEQPDVDLGVHLTLNAEYERYRWGPVAGRSAVPSLVDPAGHLMRTTRETVKQATVDDVETELRAQIDAALVAGVDVTHLDSHMGSVMHPKFLDVYLRLARDYRLPVFLPRRINGFPPDDPISIEAARRAAELEADGFVAFDGYCAESLGFAFGAGVEHNARRIRDLRPGLNYLICHPARAGDELSAITDTAHQRDFERRYYGGDEGRATLEAAGVQTVGMRALRDLLRSTT